MPRPLLLLALLAPLAACVPPPGPPVLVAAPRPVAEPVLMNYPPIPPPQVEVIPVAPRRSVVWQPGHWHWTGFRYDWIGGHYVERVRAPGRWMPGHWEPRPGGYVWVGGRWV